MPTTGDLTTLTSAFYRHPNTLICRLDALSTEDLIDIAVSRLEDQRVRNLLLRLILWTPNPAIPDPLPSGWLIVPLCDTPRGTQPEEVVAGIDVDFVRDLCRDVLAQRGFSPQKLADEFVHEGSLNRGQRAKIRRRTSEEWALLTLFCSGTQDWPIFVYGHHSRKAETLALLL